MYPRWMDLVVVGSVLRSRSGDLRVVREVTKRRNGKLAFVVFAIRHCSWTRRAYTCVYYQDLIARGFRPVRAKPRRLTSAADRRLHEAITEAIDKRPYAMTCCQAEALP